MVFEISMFWCGAIMGAVAAIVLVVALVLWYANREKKLGK